MQRNSKHNEICHLSGTRDAYAAERGHSLKFEYNYNKLPALVANVCIRCGRQANAHGRRTVSTSWAPSYHNNAVFKGRKTVRKGAGRIFKYTNPPPVLLIIHWRYAVWVRRARVCICDRLEFSILFFCIAFCAYMCCADLFYLLFSRFQFFSPRLYFLNKIGEYVSREISCSGRGNDRSTTRQNSNKDSVTAMLCRRRRCQV